MRRSIKEVINDFNNESCSIKELSNELFYDWFCKDSSLPRKTENLLKRISNIIKHQNKFDIEKTYMFFANRCPVIGKLYDQIVISDIETEEALFAISINHNGKNEIYSNENDFEKAIVSGKWSDIKNYFK